MKTYKVNLTYFKKSGKYYTEGTYLSKKEGLQEIFEEVQAFARSGNLPELVQGISEFYVTIDVPDHPHNHLHLVVL